MKRIHYLFLGLGVSLCLAATVGPVLQPTTYTALFMTNATASQARSYLGLGSALTNMNQTQFDSTSTNIKSGALVTNLLVSSGTRSLLTVGNASANNTTASIQLVGKSSGGTLLSNNLYYANGYTYWADSAGTNILRYDNGAHRTHIPHLEGPGYYRGMIKFGSALPTSENTDGMVSISQGFTNTTANVRALRVDSQATTLSSGYAYANFDAAGAILGNNNYDHLIGFQARPSFGSSIYTGNINELFGFGSYITHAGLGIVSNAYGLNINQITRPNTGTVNTAYGVYIASLTNATANWALYSAGASTPSFHAGPLSVGSMTNTDLTANTFPYTAASGKLTSSKNGPSNTPRVIYKSTAETTHTGNTTRTTLSTWTIPANTMGSNDTLMFSIACFRATVGTAQYWITVGGTNGWTAGPAAANPAAPHIGLTRQETMFINNNSTASQLLPYNNVGTATYLQTSTLDFTTDLTVNVDGQLSLGTDTLTNKTWMLIVYPAP